MFVPNNKFRNTPSTTAHPSPPAYPTTATSSQAPSKTLSPATPARLVIMSPVVPGGIVTAYRWNMKSIKCSTLPIEIKYWKWGWINTMTRVVAL